MSQHPLPLSPISWHCSGCGDSGLAPGVCDRCHHEYLPDDPNVDPAAHTELAPWRHVATAHAFAAFARRDNAIQWIDTALGLSLWPLMLGLFLTFAALGSNLPSSAPHWAHDWAVALCMIAPYLLLASWALAMQYLAPVAYRALASVLLSEGAIRQRSRVAALSALEEGPAVVIGETAVVEPVALPHQTPALAVQSIACSPPLPTGEYIGSDGTGGRLLPSIGGRFFLADESGPPLLVCAEHVVIEAPHLDGVVPLGSRVAVSGNVRWVTESEGYRGGHGHWEMIGTWDQPVIVRVLRAGPAPTTITERTRTRISDADSATDAALDSDPADVVAEGRDLGGASRAAPPSNTR